MCRGWKSMTLFVSSFGRAPMIWMGRLGRRCTWTCCVSIRLNNAGERLVGILQLDRLFCNLERSWIQCAQQRMDRTSKWSHFSISKLRVPKPLDRRVVRHFYVGSLPGSGGATHFWCHQTTKQLLGLLQSSTGRNELVGPSCLEMSWFNIRYVGIF